MAAFGGDFREAADLLHARGIELLGAQVAVRLAGARVGGDALQVTVGEHALREWRKDRAAEAFLLHDLEQARLGGAFEEAVLGLMHDARRAELAQEGARARGVGGIIVGDRGVQRLARADRLGERAHGLFERRVRIAAVAIEDVHVRQAHPLQRLVERREEVLTGAEIAVRSGPHGVAGLGGDDQFIAVGAEVFAQDTTKGLFGAARYGSVVVREVEVRDAEVEGAQGDRTRVGVVVDAPEVMPEAERDLGQVQPGLSAAGLERLLGVAGGVGRMHDPNQFTVPDEASA